MKGMTFDLVAVDGCTVFSGTLIEMCDWLVMDGRLIYGRLNESWEGRNDVVALYALLVNDFGDSDEAFTLYGDDCRFFLAQLPVGEVRYFRRQMNRYLEVEK